ncbi:hypothetical protein MRX96_045362 [Rhipicephalus microplus]
MLQGSRLRVSLNEELGVPQDRLANKKAKPVHSVKPHSQTRASNVRTGNILLGTPPCRRETSATALKTTPRGACVHVPSAAELCKRVQLRCALTQACSISRESAVDSDGADDNAEEVAGNLPTLARRSRVRGFPIDSHWILLVIRVSLRKCSSNVGRRSGAQTLGASTWKEKSHCLPSIAREDIHLLRRVSESHKTRRSDLAFNANQTTAWLPGTRARLVHSSTPPLVSTGISISIKENAAKLAD